MVPESPILAIIPSIRASVAAIGVLSSWDAAEKKRRWFSSITRSLASSFSRGPVTFRAKRTAPRMPMAVIIPRASKDLAARSP
jgi:hypothetical protein